MTYLFPQIFILISVPCLFIAIFLVMRPQLAIEIQKRFYAKINWKIEPISMSKEIRNTRIMGWFLILFWIAALVYFALEYFTI